MRRTLPEEETVPRWARREYAAVRLRLTAPSTLGDYVRLAQARHCTFIDAAVIVARCCVASPAKCAGG